MIIVLLSVIPFWCLLCCTVTHLDCGVWVSDDSIIAFDIDISYRIIEKISNFSIYCDIQKYCNISRYFW